MEKSMPAPPPGFTTGPAQPSNYGAPPSYSAPPVYTTDEQPRVVIVSQQFGPTSQTMTCPHCRAQISTRVENESSTKTHLFALVLCLFGLWCCVPIPYCCDTCMTQNHYCPSCNAYLGKCDN